MKRNFIVDPERNRGTCYRAANWDEPHSHRQTLSRQPFDYLCAIVTNAERVIACPSQWLPWNYKLGSPLHLELGTRA